MTEGMLALGRTLCFLRKRHSARSWMGVPTISKIEVVPTKIVVSPAKAVVPRSAVAATAVCVVAFFLRRVSGIKAMSVPIHTHVML